MPLSIIVAVAHNGCIGKNNELPWYLPEDLKHFKKLTVGHTVVMGRKTYESILKRLGKPLPDRTSIVITRQADYPVPPGVFVYNSLHNALGHIDTGEVFCIGGGELYAAALPLAHKLYLTKIQQTVDGDTFFPEFDKNDWQEIEREEKNGYCFFTYHRRSSRTSNI